MGYEHSESTFDEDLVSTSTAKASTPATRPATPPIEGQFVAPEVIGDPPVARPPSSENVAVGEADQELENPIGGGEFTEASAAQLAAESGEESAISDLKSLEGGYEPTTAAEATEETELQEVGTALGGAQEAADPEFAFLAGLLPALVSTVGPPLAKAVASRLKPKTRERVKRIAAAVKPGTAANTKGGLIALLAKLLESAKSSSGGESGALVDETLATEAAAAMEVIIGTDDRVRITATTSVPWRRICALRITFQSGSVYRGTGFLIGPRAIATAGHCVYLHNQGGWARQIEVIPGADGSTRPYGQVVSTQFRSVTGWVTQRRPASDYGCVVLPTGAFGGRNLGYFGFAAWSAPDLLARPAVLAGYPGDKPFAEIWGMSRKLKSVTPEQLMYEIDTMGGQSGAPVYIMRNSQRYVVGIHNYGAGSGNSATRITQPVYQRLAAWRQI